MTITTIVLLENFHLYCEKCFELDSNLRLDLKKLSPKDLWLIINKSFSNNKTVSKRFLQLRFIELLGAKLLTPISYLESAEASFRLTLIKKGFYNDFDIFDDICLNKLSDNTLREFCSNYCSIETSKKLLVDKNEKIRAISFSRVGPKDSFALMHKDPAFSIRQSAAIICPHHSEEAFVLANDKSKRVIKEAINKISLDKVLFLLGNAKITNNKRLLKVLQDRLNKNV